MQRKRSYTRGLRHSNAFAMTTSCAGLGRAGNGNVAHPVGIEASRSPPTTDEVLCMTLGAVHRRRRAFSLRRPFTKLCVPSCEHDFSTLQSIEHYASSSLSWMFPSIIDGSLD